MTQSGKVCGRNGVIAIDTSVIVLFLLKTVLVQSELEFMLNQDTPR